MSRVTLSAGMVGLASLVAAALTHADPPDCTVRQGGPAVLGIATPCETTAQPSFGWASDRFNRSEWLPFQGFPSNLSLGYGAAPPNMPPLSNSPGAGTSPLVPARNAHFGGATAAPERVLVAGRIDAVTGSPLVHETDLELWFGGAIYRHVRSYFEPPSSFWHESEPREIDTSTPPPHAMRDYVRRRSGSLASEMLSDWHGQGWMMGEAPVFLFDACPLGIGAVAASTTHALVQTRYCYFIPDAHHSIPFERQADGSYVAPPQFDAVLRCRGGTFETSSQTWTVLPTTVEVWLHNGTVQYTIALEGDTDVPAPLHHSPLATGNAGVGMPYRGHVTAIADRWGNRIEFEYGAVGQVTAQTNNAVTPPCFYCHQDTPSRGQIARVKLMAAGSTTPAWSLLFTYRAFMDNQLWASEPSGLDPTGSVVLSDPYTYRRHRQLAVHSIHAYEGDVGVARGCVTIDPETFWAAAKAALLAQPSNVLAEKAKTALAAMDAVTAPNLPTGWAHEVRYLYAEPNFNGADTVMSLIGVDFLAFYKLAGLEFGHVDTDTPHPVAGKSNLNPRLLKTMRSSAKPQTAPEIIRESVYRYDHPKIHEPNSQHWLYDNHVLWGIYDQGALATVTAGIQAAKASWPTENPCNAYIPESKSSVYDALVAPLTSRITPRDGRCR